LTIALGLSYCFRKQLKKAWIPIHRVLTVTILIVLVIHVAQVGITLPNLFQSESAAEPSTSQAITSTEETPAEIESSATAAAETILEAEVTDEADEDNPTQFDIMFSGAKLKDGTYEGSAEGYKGTIQVSVTVESGAVTSISIVNQNDTPKFWSRAVGLLDTIMSEQSLEVDAVSGATYSSKGILCAVYDALEDAVYEGELQVSIPEPSGRKH